MGEWKDYILHPKVTFSFVNSWGCTYNPFALYFPTHESDHRDHPRVGHFEAHAQPQEREEIAPEFFSLVKEARRLQTLSSTSSKSTSLATFSFLQCPCSTALCQQALAPCPQCGLIDVCLTHKDLQGCPHCARPSHHHDHHGKVCAPTSKTLRKWRTKHSSWLDALRFAQERISIEPNKSKSYFVKIGLNAFHFDLRNPNTFWETPTHLGITTPYRTLAGFSFAPMSLDLDESIIASLSMVLVLSNRAGHRTLIPFGQLESATSIGYALYQRLVSPLGEGNVVSFPLAPINPIPPTRFLKDAGEVTFLVDIWQAFFRFVHDRRPHTEFARLHHLFEEEIRSCYFTTRIESERPLAPLKTNLPSSPSTEFEVRALRGHRVHHGRLQYFVLYQGYPRSAGTWEDRRSLMETCPLFVRRADSRRLHQRATLLGFPHRKRKRGSD